jgi:16S rRNA (cytosine1402-N4)-methyltransferase
MVYHVPVLLHESIEGLNVKPDGTYVDLTFGGGGHSRHILDRLGPRGRLIAFDQDEEALQNAIDDKRFTLIRSNFRYFRNFLRYHGVAHVNGVLADLGVSSHHFDSPGRGFSFRFEGPLDMRMNRRSALTAHRVVNGYSPEEITRIMAEYGELPNARRVANTICADRQTRPIETVEHLAELLKPLFPANSQSKMLAMVFQAIRIEVNREMDALKQMLLNASKCLERDGRLVVISYHSLEDRLVKNFFRAGNFEGTIGKDFFGKVQVPFEQLNRKVITPTAQEIEGNSRARSAKLRIGVKL